MTEILSYCDGQKQWNSKADIEHVVQDLNSKKDCIVTLQFSGNTLGVEAAENLVEPLSFQSNLKHLLWHDLFTGRLKSEIGVALKSLSLGLMRAKVNLVEINLSDNAFGPNGVVGVTDLLSSPYCYTLKILNMNNQGLGHQGCRYLIDALKTARINSNKQGMNLEVFIAGRNRLENAGMKMLTEVFGDGMSSLKKLVLLQNGIGVHGVEGVEDLIISIKNHVNLKILNMSDNTIKPNGMKRLSNILTHFEDLEELYMGDCLIGNSGLNYLTRIMDEISPSLKVISVSGNEIKGISARDFVSTLVETKHYIEKVDLSENEIKASFKCEINDIMEEHDKGHVLVQEDNSDDEDNVEEIESEDDDEESYEETCSENDSDVSEDSETNGSEIQESEKDSEPEIHDHKPQNIFSTDKSNSTKFTFTKNQNETSVFSKNASTNLFKTNGNAESNLFNTKNNIFLNSGSTENKFSFGTNNTNKPFSFLAAAKPEIKCNSEEDIKKLQQFISINMHHHSVMSISSDLPLTKNIIISDKDIICGDICQLSEKNPENTIRIGLILCNQSMLFNIGTSLINYVLNSTVARSRATNAILVEMNSIKSEEKKFIPFCNENVKLPIKVLKSILVEKSSLPEEVQKTLITVLTNLNKHSNDETDDLLKTLQCLKI